MRLIFCLIWCCLWCGGSAHFSSFTRLVGIGEPNARPSLIGTSLKAAGLNFVTEDFIVQKLDHFNPTDNRTWKQRYQARSEYHKPGGPVFLLLGGEEKISKTWMKDGSMMEYAEKFNAMCFQLEHRYYGESYPTDNLNTTNLAYLTIKQALADVAAFIKDRSQNQLRNSKWVLFGGSYPGSLAAWARSTYPHLVYAAVSSSSVIKTRIDNIDYFKVAEKALSDYNPKCVSNIRQATMMISDLLESENGTKYVQSKFKACYRINTDVKRDVRQLFQQLSLPIAETIQYNKDNRYYSNMEKADLSITALCDHMSDKSLGNPFDRYVFYHRRIRHVFKRKCSSYSYQSSLKSNSEIYWHQGSVKSGDRQWFYQLCTEIGNFVTSNEEDHLFGNTIPIDFFTDLCTDVFGEYFNLNELEKAVHKTTMMYHGLKNTTSRVIYLHGSFDPWNGLGLTEPESDDSISIFIEGVSHCADLYPSSSRDPPELSKARETVILYLNKWLTET
ncbi:putative serine protease K12H4.7 [Metopolophium dirhodum]|uniref:putative serine protease K12H4.7 n=1 Tax=Metopolophium dirhodum TaxID=44670 RepID=UPI00298FFAE0|nr:putative serine protease K12H4.7 [Metopolophium dirhodum]